MSSSLDELVEKGLVKPWHPSLGPRRLPLRRLFVTKEFEEWASSLASDKREKHRLLAPAVELSEIAAQFVAGEKVVSFIRRIDPPKGEGILRINTTSFRLGGWCPAPQTLILALGAHCRETHGSGKPLNKFGKKIVAIRKAMGVTHWAKGEFYELFRAAN